MVEKEEEEEEEEEEEKEEEEDFGKNSNKELNKSFESIFNISKDKSNIPNFFIISIIFSVFGFEE
jgi:hypothetical protein